MERSLLKTIHSPQEVTHTDEFTAMPAAKRKAVAKPTAAMENADADTGFNDMGKCSSLRFPCYVYVPLVDHG